MAGTLVVLRWDLYRQTFYVLYTVCWQKVALQVAESEALPGLGLGPLFNCGRPTCRRIPASGPIQSSFCPVS